MPLKETTLPREISISNVYAMDLCLRIHIHDVVDGRLYALVQALCNHETAEYIKLELN